MPIILRCQCGKETAQGYPSNQGWSIKPTISVTKILCPECRQKDFTPAPSNDKGFGLVKLFNEIEPPFKLGEIIIVIREDGAKPTNNLNFDSHHLVIPHGKTETVFKTYYEHSQEGTEWLIKVLGREPLYAAKDFCLAKKQSPIE